MKMMKDSTKALMVLVLLGALAAVPCVIAQDEDEVDVVVQPKVVELTGTVIVTRDDDEAITGVVLKVAGGDVAVKLDENGKKLAEAAGKAVKVTGSIAVAGDVKTITVQKFAVVVVEDKEEDAE